MTYLCELERSCDKAVSVDLLLVEDIKHHKRWAESQGYRVRYFKLTEVKQ